MKIAVLCPGFGRIPRGIETVVLEIFSRLSNQFNYNIDIYTGSKNFNVDFANIISVPVIQYNTKLAEYYSKIAKKFHFTANEPYDFDFGTFAITGFTKMLFKKYDIIFNKAGLYMQYALNLYRKIYNTPVIHSGHAGINKLEFKIARLKPDVYLASSVFAFEEMKKRWRTLDVRVLPNGVNIVNNNKKIEFNTPKPVILFVGALEPYKRIFNLLEAFKKLNKGSLIIIGDGSEKNKLIKEINNSSIKNVKMIDFVPLNELQTYFNSSDLFVLPSKNETFGIVYLNALIANIPAIADYNPVQKWLLNDAGLLCNCEDTDELSKTIDKALSSDFGSKPKERAKFYDWNKCAECYHLLIEEKVNKKGIYNWKNFWL